MKLTKKYRLIWDDEKKLLFDPYHDWSGTETTPGDGRSFFESDNIQDIEAKIIEENLSYNEN